MSLDLAVIILAYNEEMHIERALKSIAPFASEVFVIDSYSTDRTAELARANGAQVLQNKFINYAKQFQWAMDNVPSTATWFMRLDADEIIEADLAAEIIEKLPCLGEEVAGVNLKRKHIFLDRWIRHGGRYPLILMRIWRRGQGRIEDRWMDEHMVVWGGKTVTFQGGFADHNIRDITFFVTKHNSYATREALDVLNQKYRFLPLDAALSSDSASPQAAIKRFVKEKIYNRMPFWISSSFYFFYRYFFQLGFLDGVPGLIYHFNQGYWYRFLVGSKLYEIERVIKEIPDKRERSKKILEMTGYKGVVSLD